MSILTQFLSNQSQHVMVDGCLSTLVNVVSEVPQGSVFRPVIVLMAVVPSPGVRVAVTLSMIRDLGRVSEWCDLWGMKLNGSKTKTMIVSRSPTVHPY